MAPIAELPLILGGHSFFSHMGNDPVPDAALARDIVNTCLDAGIRRFDTTHQPERVALGQALRDLDRRDDAYIIAWNFMKVLEPGEKMDRPVEFTELHLYQLMDELQTDFLDAVVVHDLDDGTPEEHARQEAEIRSWQLQGLVSDLGFWAPNGDARARFGNDNPFSFMIRPLNAYNAADNALHFTMSQELGWKTYACSPFIRGWFLDKMVEQGQAEGTNKAALADMLLRYALFHPHVDMVVTAIRLPEWIAPNIESVARGPLSEEEKAWVEGLAARVEM
jgi:aryl-alcohol dehydrogenase-like predicted oxidoreductase